MGSIRLPGKSVMPLAGEPLIVRILERLKRVTKVDRIILAIPATKADDQLEEIGHKMSVDLFRGSENDLLDRYYQAAKKFDTDIVLRFPADNVAPEPTEIDRLIDFYLNNSFDFCSNLAQVFSNGYPDGIGAEIFPFALLEKFAILEQDPEKREHVHLNFFDYKTQKPTLGITVGAPECPTDIKRPDIIIDVNTLEQYQHMSKMYDDLHNSNPEFTIREIIKWWDKNKIST